MAAHNFSFLQIRRFRMSTVIYNWHEKDDAQQMSGQLVVKSEAKASGVLTKYDVVYFRFRSRAPNADFDFDYTSPPGYGKFGLTPASHPFPGAPGQDSLQRNAGIWMDQYYPHPPSTSDRDELAFVSFRHLGSGSELDEWRVSRIRQNSSQDFLSGRGYWTEA
jgi:hypothetical protein